MLLGMCVTANECQYITPLSRGGREKAYLVHFVGGRAAERIGGAQGKYKSGAQQNFEILHALKFVVGSPEALLRACTQYIYTCKLPSSI